MHFFALVDIIAFEGELVLPHFWNSMMHSQLDTDLCLKIDVVKNVLGSHGLFTNSSALCFRQFL